MKIAKVGLLVLLGLGALYAFGRFFLSQLGPGRPSELAAVILAPPPGYRIIERGELSSGSAAAELEVEVLRGGTEKVGIHFERQGAVVYWLTDPAADLLEERSAGANGTRLATVWRGSLRDRLAWARVHGDPSVPGLPPPERTNLYH
ncbi:MAG TPA: hypothetical protein VGS22_19715 [Thermoanaerobaculia bacterium]|jgi:hypothetical protein|nr:hypothetical protein [Thermoanaerobaculia bacterium]